MQSHIHLTVPDNLDLVTKFIAQVLTFFLGSGIRKARGVGLKEL